MTGKIDKIRIRMYNTGSVGDCILLLLEKQGRLTFKMLIDCGGYKTKADKIQKCVGNICDICGGELDLLVVTHEHEDHISGFNLARELFDTIKVDRVWMSWVEKPTDDIAIKLKSLYGKKVKEARAAFDRSKKELDRLGKIATGLVGKSDRLKARKEKLDKTLSLLDFEDGVDHGPGLSKGAATNRDAMQYVKGKSDNLDYRFPGEVIANLKGAEGIKFYILGPPREKELTFLKIQTREEEIYNLAARTAAGADRVQVQEHMINSGIMLSEGASPFHEKFKVTPLGEKDFWEMYNHEDDLWRQIETDWQESPDGLALALTRFVNNTSLAMAMEFEDSGKVLLLPGDAQSGNWMSWHRPEIMQALKEKGGKNTSELLANTVFYKVGHHGSENGTASLSGLELICDKELVAFMPLVKEKVPAGWGGPDNFPAKKLYQVIIDKTSGRVVRADEGVATDQHAADLRNGLSPADRKKLKDNLIPGDCFFEYSIDA